MAQSREWLIQWLRDAHAMWKQAETMLNGQLSRIETTLSLATESGCMLRKQRSRLPGSGDVWTALMMAFQH